MDKNNAKKNVQLGMPFGTATNRLRKNLLFTLIQRLGENMCFQCGQEIQTVEELSIEHKIAWLDSDDPIGLFFDLDNIAFSHLSCNVSHGRKPLPADAIDSICPGCGIVTQKTPKQVWKALRYFGHTGYCSLKCAAQHGHNHPMRNGEYNLVIAPNGYPGSIYRGRYCYEHQLVYWQRTGLSPRGKRIIHKNGDRRDNRFENLEIR